MEESTVTIAAVVEFLPERSAKLQDDFEYRAHEETVQRGALLDERRFEAHRARIGLGKLENAQRQRDEQPAGAQLERSGRRDPAHVNVLAAPIHPLHGAL